jgi:hypothetical protein
MEGCRAPETGVQSRSPAHERRIVVKTPIFGLLLGGLLGALDGLSALVSAPETSTQIVGIVIGSTLKGLIAGVLIGWFATRVNSLPLGILFGLGVGFVLALLVALMPAEDGTHYYWEIILPGSLVGVLVGYATQRWSQRRLAS